MKGGLCGGRPSAGRRRAPPEARAFRRPPHRRTDSPRDRALARTRPATHRRENNRKGDANGKPKAPPTAEQQAFMKKMQERKERFQS